MRTRQDILNSLTTDVLHASEVLLGTVLVRGNRRARIVEVEAYRAEDDPACHGHRGKTNRTQVMFGPPGRAYVYFNYGVHWMLNVTAHPEGVAAAILIRAALPLSGLDEMRALRPKARTEQDLLSGPGKIAAALEITGKDNGAELFESASDLRIEPGEAPSRVVAGRRIGISVARDLEWRYADGDRLEWVSKPPPPSYR